MFRALKVLAILAIAGALIRWYGQHHVEDNIARLVREHNAQLPKVLAPGVTLTAMEYANHTVRTTMVFAEKVDFGLRRAEAEKMLLNNYCSGGMKVFADAATTVEYIVNYHTELGIASTATISLTPQKCS
jgi:hypothetical protein